MRPAGSLLRVIFRFCSLRFTLIVTACGGGGGGGGGAVPATNIPRYAFVANNSDNSVSSYVVDAAAGRLKYIGKVATGANPNSVTVDPSGRYAYVANGGSANVSQYTIGANGALTPMATATVAAGAGPASVTVDPAGKYAYVANDGSANVSQYTIGGDGALTPIAPLTAVAKRGPVSLAMTKGTAAAQAVPNYAYAANANDYIVSQYTIGADGALTPMAAATVAAGTCPTSVTADPSGKYAYVANGCGH